MQREKIEIDLKHVIEELREMCLAAGFTQEEIDACKGGNENGEYTSRFINKISI